MDYLALAERLGPYANNNPGDIREAKVALRRLDALERAIEDLERALFEHAVLYQGFKVDGDAGVHWIRLRAAELEKEPR